MIFDFLIDVFLGLVLHQSRHVTEKLPDGWRDLTDHAVGVVGTSPAYVFHWHRLKNVTDPFERGFLAFVLSFCGVGSGVALGWLLDTFVIHKPKK